MSRIANAYASKFKTLLSQFHARRIEQGTRWFLTRAERLSETEGISPAQALAQLHARTLASWRGFAVRHVKGAGQEAAKPIAGFAANGSLVFLCDAGLGGLARWLRAAGYEAIWIPDIDDDELLREGARRQAIILTTDSMLMERRLLRDGILPAVWVPPTLKMLEQLALVLGELGLKPRESRCMSCGGELQRVDKEAVRDRIPPRTYRWRDEFFECARCRKLFWHGTHWEKITTRLHKL
ncbi:MAG: hypothetical protein JWR69_839 [Pedosphaera sp.]|nr:hypothetical protein [Pedosphaera sp.]